jgi:putative oxidoreductase
MLESANHYSKQHCYMKNRIQFSARDQSRGLAAIRIIIGLFMIYHGWETFERGKIIEYTTWDVFKHLSSPSFPVYLGKIAELVSGSLLLLGLFTRLAAILLAGTMLYISFFIGHGKIWYEDQYPFLFALLALVFFITGPGAWSLDRKFFSK